MINSASSTIDFAANEIRSADAVVILGAGVSFAAGMPLAGQLAPLVWHALDANPIALTALCTELGVPFSSAKTVVADDSDKVNRAFRHLKGNTAAYRTFQRSICDLDASRAAATSVPHNALARLVHARKVVEVVSFNWDTLLETAFQHRYGFDINAQASVLTKPHGDCRALELEWILPHEAGLVPASVVERLRALAAVRPRVLLIIGYSERDAEVVKQLIQPFASRWRVIRVSPSATGEGAVPVSAGAALEELVRQLAPEPDVPGWSVVTFANQRGIEAALAGERLGPRDVEACPRLPHFGPALEKLSLLNAVEIAGDSGSGKSITVWQLAYELHRQGWQVVRLDAAQAQQNPLDAVRTQAWRTVAIVDDSQIFARDTITGLRELANDRLKVVLGTTDPTGEQHGAVRAAAKNAVEALAAHCRQHRKTLLPLVRSFDSHIGDGFLDQRLETRIDFAVKERTPWQFAYVLRGGARRIRELLGAARDFGQADLLLVLIGLRQLVSLDAGTPVDKLVALSASIGKDEAWVRSALASLVRQRAILVSDVVRCLHLMAAGTLVEVALDESKGDDYEHVVTLLRDALRDSSVPLYGVSWLLHRIWGLHDERVVAPEIKFGLIARCFLARTHLEIRDSCFVIERLLGRRDQELLTQIFVYQDQLRTWIINADAIDAYAIGGVLNNIRNDSRKRLNELIKGIAPEILAQKAGLLSLEHGYVLGSFFRHLSVDKNDPWGASVAEHLPRDRIRVIVQSATPTQVADLFEFLKGIAHFDFDFALELFELATPFLAHEAGRDSLRLFHELFDMSFWILGEGLFYDSKPNRRQRQISKRIFDGLRPGEVATGIISCRYGDWENYARLLSWVRRAHPAKHRAIVEALDWALFDTVTADMLAIPGRELTVLLGNLVLDVKTHEPVCAWLRGRTGKMQEIGPRIVALCPYAAPTVLAQGGKIDMSRDHVSWGFDGYVIARTAALDENAAKEIIRSNTAHFAKGITELSFPEGMGALLNLLAGEPELLDAILALVDIGLAKTRWPHALADARPEHRRGAREALAFLAQRGKGELRQLAAELPRQVRYRRRHTAAEE